MWTTIILYGAGLAVGALALQWLEYSYLARVYPVAIYVGLVALAFTALGIWLGARLFRRPATKGLPFDGNPQAVASLGVSTRELEVLGLIAAGQSNKQIAASLAVSPNTVKTHVGRLYDKLDVSRRTEAVMRARELGLIR
ncbi:MAG: helix-turn-helix transcriptional regulator [Alphaproteobacteria bacterium]|nr:helix-turn-helix transcriptional regulator [Alphaproteobacteria bacterium]